MTSKADFHIEGPSSLGDFVLRHMQTLAGRWTPAGLLTQLNPAWEIHFHRPLKDLENSPLVSLIHPDDQANLIDFFNSPKPGGLTCLARLFNPNSTLAEWTLEKSTGGDIYFYASPLPQYYKDLFEASANTSTSFSEVQRVGGLQRLTTDSLGIGVWELNLETLDVYWEEGNYRLYGYTSSDGLSPIEIWQKVTSTSETDRLLEVFRDAHEKGHQTKIEELIEVTLPDRSHKYISIIAYAHNHPEDPRPLIRGISMDVSEAEEARRRLNLVLESLSLGIWEYQPQCDLITWSPTLHKIFGVKPQDFDGSLRNFLEFVIPEDREKLSREAACCVEFGTEFNTQFRILNPKTGVRTIRARAYTEKNPNGEVIRLIGLNWDITEDIERDLELETQRRMTLNQARLAAIGEMAAGIAHEINNPLTIIMGNAERLNVLLKDGKWEPSQLQLIGEKVIRTSERIHKIVKSLKSLSRDASLSPFESCKLDEILDESLHFAEERLKSHGIQLKKNFVQTGVKIKARPVEISQVFINLLNNSIDAIKEMANAWIAVDLHTEGRNAVVYFTDSGPGIPAEIASRIMSPFFTTKASHEGTGLGLSISESLLKAHKGSIRLDKTYESTRFIITLPLDMDA